MSGSGYSLGSTLYAFMKHYRNRIAQYIDDTDEVDTYGQLLTRCTRVAIKLQEFGIGEDDTIGICTPNHKNTCVPFVASTFVGAIPVSFDPNPCMAVTVKLLRLIEPKVMFISSELLEEMGKYLKEAKLNPRIVVFGKTTGKYNNFDDLLKPPSKDEKDFKVYQTEDSKKTAVIVFSSGTSGLPNGVCLSHYSLLCDKHLKVIDNVMAGTADTVLLLYSNIYWVTAVLTIVSSITRGEARVICGKFDERRCWDIIEKYKVTWMNLQPVYITELLRSRPKANLDISSLKVIPVGGSPVTTKQIESLRAAFPHALVSNLYGMTEAAGAVAFFYRPEDIELMKKKPTSVGRVMDRYRWKIVSLETEKPLGPNEQGEIRIKCDTMMTGYYKEDCHDIYDAEGYFKTGDIGYYDSDNCLFITDRLKDMMKYRGYQIAPAVIEGILLEHPAVKEAAVIGIPHENNDHPMAVVVLKDGETATAEEIQNYVDGKVSDAQKLRGGVKFTDKLPRTVTGKLRRRELRDIVLRGAKI